METTLDVADTQENARAFGRPRSPRGVNQTGAFPQLRLLGLVETGTHVICGARLGSYDTREVALATELLSDLGPEILWLADRGFLGFDLWKQAMRSGAALVWRASRSLKLPAIEPRPDGSYRSELRWNPQCASEDRSPVPVRVIRYTQPGVPDAEAQYRLVTCILDPGDATALKLAELYHERWEIEAAFDEFKTHLKGGQGVLRSKTPELVRQEAWDLLLARFAIRGLMHEAALLRARGPDTMSFTHAVRVARRALPHLAAISPSAPSTHAPDDSG